jgi:hypothetical protein
MFSLLQVALAATFPWEACLTAGFLFQWMLAWLIGARGQLQRKVAFMVVGVQIGVIIPLLFGTPEVWTYPLFTLGAWLSARGIFGPHGDGRWDPGSGRWHRISQGIWCLGVSGSLVYAVNHYTSLTAVIGATQFVAFGLSGAAVLCFALALAACAASERAATASAYVYSCEPEYDRPGQAGHPVPYPLDFPTLPATMATSVPDGRLVVVPALPSHAGSPERLPGVAHARRLPGLIPLAPIVASAVTHGAHPPRQDAGFDAAHALPSSNVWNAWEGAWSEDARSAERGFSPGASYSLPPLAPALPSPRRRWPHWAGR